MNLISGEIYANPDDRPKLKKRYEGHDGGEYETVYQAVSVLPGNPDDHNPVLIFGGGMLFAEDVPFRLRCIE